MLQQDRSLKSMATVERYNSMSQAKDFHFVLTKHFGATLPTSKNVDKQRQSKSRK